MNLNAYSLDEPDINAILILKSDMDAEPRILNSLINQARYLTLNLLYFPSFFSPRGHRRTIIDYCQSINHKDHPAISIQ